jgi:colanic acid/amylovoran biosynthesis glycosyltransferase
VPGEHGWLVPAGDVDALANALRACLDSSAETIASLGKNAQSQVLQRHAIDTEAAKLVRHFEVAINAEPT